MGGRIIEPGRIVQVTTGDGEYTRTILIGIVLVPIDLAKLAGQTRAAHASGLEAAFMDDTRFFCRGLVECGYVKPFREWTELYCPDYGDFEVRAAEETATILLDRDLEN